MQTYFLPDRPICPNCSRKQDGALGAERMPKHLDYGVCAYCASINRYVDIDGKIQLRIATEKDIQDAKDRDILGNLYATQDFVKMMALHKNENW